MSLLSAQNLAKSYGAKDIFSGITIEVPRQARIAILGPNGIGKTTLLRILLGLEEPSEGLVQSAKGLNAGYLPQEAGFQADHSLWEECLKAVKGLLEQEAELARLEKEMSQPDLAQDALEKYGKLQQTFEIAGGYTYETRMRSVLSGLGFAERDYSRPLTQLSGGQRTRARLARLLLSDPDLLVLDEPTNHLDISAVEWLENYLEKWEGSILLVSHDRYFLDRVVDTVWEMSQMGIEVYRGNYSACVEQRQDRWERRRSIFKSEKERLLKELDYIKRNIASQRTQLAKGKLKRLSREVQAIESLGTETVRGMSWGEISSEADISEHAMGLAEVESRIKALREPSNRPPQLSMDLKTSHRSGELVLRTLGLEIGYHDEGKPLFRSPDLLLRLGECAAVIGPNGAGKTTLLKTLLGQVPPFSGEVVLGASLKIGYFAQAHEDLDPQRTLVQEVESVVPKMLLADIRNYLARFLFQGEDVFRKVSTLSGGERGRLALALLALRDTNLLLLDEPTNHLDIPSQEILQEVLMDYAGTMMLVSHDRYLIDALGSQIWEIQPDQAGLRVFHGSYSEYHQQQVETEIEGTPADARKMQKNLAERRKANAELKLARQQRARLQEVENRIADLEKQLGEISKELENPPDDHTKVLELGEGYIQVQVQMDQLLEEWEALNNRLKLKSG
ncbi:MAG: ribosomal protection-like ABC-F family protein [Anaerolineales bacterium]|jgi:ATP-binding cassette subfamily F protein 3